MGKSSLTVAWCCGLLMAATAGAMILPQETPPSSPRRPPDGGANDLLRQFGAGSLKWLPDLDAAQRLAARDNQSVMAYFFSPLCSWCQRMDQEVLTSPEVRRRLAAFVLVRINILEDERTAARFRVRATPTLVFLSPEGRESYRLDGFTESSDLLRVLDGIMVNRLQSQDERVQSLIQQLHDQKLPEQNWTELIVAMGNDRYREKIQRSILALHPLPRAALVRLLQHPLLAVRLGALEVLEELTGDDFGFNPWLDQPADNKDPMSKWEAWGQTADQAGADQPTLHRVLSAEEVADFLQDLMADDLDRSTRARHMLVKGGVASLEGINAFRAAHPDLPAGSVNRLRELRYTLLLPPIHGLEASSLAHRLVFGNLDVRLSALRDAAGARRRAVPVIAEFLGDPEPLVRETAVDALVTAGGREIVAIMETHLKTEADANVIYVILRQLGNLHSKKGLNILLQHLGHPNEDLVIVALESIGKLGSDTVASQVGRCLEDSRWRVRTAALKTAEVLTLRSLTPKVTALLDDKDEFVRSAAVETLAKLGAREALPKLETLFAQDDSLKGPIVNALYKADITIPDSLVKALAGSAPSVLLSVLDHIETADLKVAPLLTAFAAHRDADVSCASLQLMAHSGMEQGPYQKAVAAQIQSGDRRRMLAIMTSVDIRLKNLARDNPAVRKADLDRPAAGTMPATSAAQGNTVAEVFAAFESPGTPPPTAGEKGNVIEDIFSAFAGKSEAREDCVDTLLRVGRKTLHSSGDRELKSAAARMLIHLGDVSGIPPTIDLLPQLAEEQRSALARDLERVRNRDGRPLIQRLLADPSTEVRQVACQALMSDGSSESCALLLLSELERKETRLQVHEAYSALHSALSRLASGPVIARTVHRWLKDSQNEAVRTLALILVSSVWSPESEGLVEPFLASASPWQRRAAFYALGRNDRPRFLKEVDRVAADSSEFVRELVPNLFMGSEEAAGGFTNYFDDQHQASDYDYSYSRRREKTPLSGEALAALRKLAQDRSERVRFSALLCLISQRQPVDLAEVVRSLERMPRDSELLQSFSEYVRRNFTTLGKEFAVVLPYLDSSDTDEAKKVYGYFGVDEDEPLPLAGPPADKAAPRVLASYVAAPAAGAAQPLRPENFRVVFFRKPGCQDCDEVARKLEQLKEPFPHLSVLEYDINKTASVLLNEALSKRFGVPPSIRLVAPSVFSGGGYLVKDDITLERLGQMLVRAGPVPPASWLSVPQEDLAAAGQDIAQRYQATGLSLILLAGLLDGINPCAFATIIFLLSYLQVSRKSPRDILQIGLAYISGVLLAYFVIGLGLARVGAIVMRLSWAGTLLTYAMTAFALVIMALNIRDGFLCRRGQLAEMTLQLPAALKQRIHELIRHSVRQAHFILVAFVLGVAISFLELACTGQVYLPTITYMIQQGETRAVWNLLAYNLAFILPLGIVFALSYSGLRSETLQVLLKRRAAWVKFGTALLFLVLAVFIAFGPRLAS